MVTAATKKKTPPPPKGSTRVLLEHRSLDVFYLCASLSLVLVIWSFASLGSTSELTCGAGPSSLAVPSQCRISYSTRSPRTRTRLLEFIMPPLASRKVIEFPCTDIVTAEGPYDTAQRESILEGGRGPTGSDGKGQNDRDLADADDNNNNNNGGRKLGDDEKKTSKRGRGATRRTVPPANPRTFSDAVVLTLMGNAEGVHVLRGHAGLNAARSAALDIEKYASSTACLGDRAAGGAEGKAAAGTESGNDLASESNGNGDGTTDGFPPSLRIVGDRPSKLYGYALVTGCILLAASLFLVGVEERVELTGDGTTAPRVTVTKRAYVPVLPTSWLGGSESLDVGHVMSAEDATVSPDGPGEASVVSTVYASVEKHHRERRHGKPPLVTFGLQLRVRGEKSPETPTEIPLLLGSRPYRGKGVRAAAELINSALNKAAARAAALKS